jgi:SRSO17 transposase
MVGLIAGRFARSGPRRRVGAYLRGLLAAGAEEWLDAGRACRGGVSGWDARLLRTADWDVEGVRDDLRGYVLEQLGDDATGVFIVDETGFVKRGVRSAGAPVHRHHRED